MPFVTNTAFTDGRAGADLNALRSAASVLTDGAADATTRFERAGKVLAAGGSGPLTVAALRGERSVAPRFGSLADDMAPSPAPVATQVMLQTVDRTPPPYVRTPPLVKALLGVPHSLTLDGAGATTVAHPGAALRVPLPSLAGVRTAHLGTSLAALTVLPRTGRGVDKTVGAVGSPPLTRLASGSVATVANAHPVPGLAQRLADLTGSLAAGSRILEGELAVITVDGRPREGADAVTVLGGATRVVCIGAGGRVLYDEVLGADGKQSSVELPHGTDRVVAVALGNSTAVPGVLPGWCSGQSLPYLGWGIGLGGGALVASAQATRITGNRERADGGWVTGRELATAGQVLTTFTDPVAAVAVVVDDRIGADAAAELGMRLQDAQRPTDPDGNPLPPQVLVDGTRSILVYAVTTTGPVPGVLVTGGNNGQLAGVVGSADGTAMLAAALTTIRTRGGRTPATRRRCPGPDRGGDAGRAAGPLDSPGDKTPAATTSPAKNARGRRRRPPRTSPRPRRRPRRRAGRERQEAAAKEQPRPHRGGR